MKNPLPLFVFNLSLGLTVLTFAATSSVAFAQNATASMNVTPLRLEVPTSDQSTQMMIRNHAQTPLDVQLRIFAWTQEEGEDQYAPTDDAFVSPSIVTIAPSEAQSFHVVANGSRDISSEKRYRVVIDELPREFEAQPGVAQTTLRLTIPLFVDRDASQPGALAASTNGQKLRFTNTGEQTVRLAGISLSSGDQTIPIKANDRMRYVQGGSWVEIELPDNTDCAQPPVRVKGQADLKAYDAIAQQVCP